MNNNYNNSKHNIYVRNLQYGVKNVYKQESMETSSSDSEFDSDFDGRLDESFNRIIKRMKDRKRASEHNSTNDGNEVIHLVKEENLSCVVDKTLPLKQSSVDNCLTHNESFNCVNEEIQVAEDNASQVFGKSSSIVDSTIGSSLTLNDGIKVISELKEKNLSRPSLSIDYSDEEMQNAEKILTSVVDTSVSTILDESAVDLDDSNWTDLESD